jgi:tetratricopeptide (TPR) repeat protein
MKFKLMSRVAAMIMIMGFAVSVNAQTATEAVDALKDGVAKKTAKDYTGALKAFQLCVNIYDEIGETENDNRVTAAAQIPKMQFKYAYSLYKAKKYDEAIAEFGVLKEYSEKYNDPDNLKKAKGVIPQLYYFKGKDLAENNDIAGAIENYEKAIELKSNYFDAYFRLAKIYSGQKNDELFSKSIEKAIEVTSKTDKKEAAKSVASTYYNNMGVESLKSNKYAEADKYFNTLMEYKEADTDIYFQLAVIYNKQSKWEKAIEAGNKSLELFKDAGTTKDAKIYYELGNSYYGKGDNTAACDAYTKANKGDYAEQAKYQIEIVLKCQ